MSFLSLKSFVVFPQAAKGQIEFHAKWTLYGTTQEVEAIHPYSICWVVCSWPLSNVGEMLTKRSNHSPDEDMKIELQKSKNKMRPHTGGRHHRIRGSYVAFDMDVMSPQEPVPPSEGNESRSEDQVDPDEFQDAAEGPETNGDGQRSTRPAGQPTEEAPRARETDTNEEAEGGDRQLQEEGLDRPGTGSEAALPIRAKRFRAGAEDGRPPNIDVHAEPPPADDEPSDSDSSAEDLLGGQWNAVCVACLRVYSRDPDLTITLVSPEDSRGASNLVRGQEPAGATM
jgi:hypothetical protein